MPTITIRNATITGSVVDPNLGFWGGSGVGNYPDAGFPSPQPPPGRPTHPIVIPPDAIAPGVPTHPIYIPVYPSHPIVIPPGSLGPGVPTHPIYLPPPIPTHPIVIPPDAVSPGVPTHPIVLPPPIMWGGGGVGDYIDAGLPIQQPGKPPHIWSGPYYPPQIWGPLGPYIDAGLPMPQPPPGGGAGAPDDSWSWGYSPIYGWVIVPPGSGGKPQPPAGGGKPPVDTGSGPAHPIQPTVPEPKKP